LAPELQAADPDAEGVIWLYRETLKAYRLRLAGRQLAPPDVELQALKILELSNATDRLLSRSTHLLVDEFQDVNPLQGRFFRTLADLGTVVDAVGDPKQSIYAFRDADVEVFRRALREGERLPDLDRTYRRSPELTEFLNRLTGTMAEHQRGFRADEAPVVRSARARTGET